MFRIGLIGLCLVAAGQQALAEDEFQASSGNDLAFEIRYTELENDALLSASCIAANTLDIRIGGGFAFGKGAREPTSGTLGDGKLSVRLDGVSVNSPDIEMTGGVMLLTSVEPDGKEMQILTSGKPIEVKPKGAKRENVSLGKTVTDELKAFVKSCKDRDL
jgi:hypothetical protein